MSNKLITNKKGMLQGPCIDVYPPQDFLNKSESNMYGAIFLNETIWGAGINGAITITFGTNNCDGCTTEGAWSYIGSQSNYFSSQNQPSMNLGFIDPPFEPFTMDGKTFNVITASRNYCSGSQCWAGWVPGATVLHEFGHALGMLHEHQSNIHDDNPLVLDKNEIYDYYNRIGLGTQAAETNVIERYECDSYGCPYSGSPFDLQSIMLYALPDSWIEGTNPTYPNFKYSEKDKEWLEKHYPQSRSESQWPTLNIKFLDGEEWQKYWVKYMIVHYLQPVVGIHFVFTLPTQPPETNPPTYAPTYAPTVCTYSGTHTWHPHMAPTYAPTHAPTYAPTLAPTYGPTNPSTLSPTVAPTYGPTNIPTLSPTVAPTYGPTNLPTLSPTYAPVTEGPQPTVSPTISPVITTAPTDGGVTPAPYTPTEPVTEAPLVDITWYEWTLILGYPRPQGNLPNSVYGSVVNRRTYMQSEYEKVLSNVY